MEQHQGASDVPWVRDAGAKIHVTCYPRSLKTLDAFIKKIRQGHIKSDSKSVTIFVPPSSPFLSSWDKYCRKPCRSLSTMILEDIDCIATSQERDDMSACQSEQDQLFIKKDGLRNMPVKKKPDGLSLSGLVNAIDGVPAPEGCVLVMTTNYPENLDPALIRPGRVDKKIAFSYADRAVAQDLFSYIYGTLSDRIASLAREFASYVPEHKLTPAEIQGYLLLHKGSPENAVKGAKDWIHNVSEKQIGPGS